MARSALEDKRYRVRPGAECKALKRGNWTRGDGLPPVGRLAIGRSRKPLRFQNLSSAARRGAPPTAEGKVSAA
jgi:hypothetical protein